MISQSAIATAKPAWIVPPTLASGFCVGRLFVESAFHSIAPSSTKKIAQ